MIDVQKLRSDFPILAREVNGKQLVYLDNGASSQKPQIVMLIQTNIRMSTGDFITYQI